jgi:two-component system NtrC family response regulator/two-component system nitrogen regulation response regulator GlnG
MAQILIVDDDAQLRLSFGKILEAEGFELRTAGSGEAGVDEVAVSAVARDGREGPAARLATAARP